MGALLTRINVAVIPRGAGGVGGGRGEVGQIKFARTTRMDGLEEEKERPEVLRLSSYFSAKSKFGPFHACVRECIPRGGV